MSAHWITVAGVVVVVCVVMGSNPHLLPGVHAQNAWDGLAPVCKTFTGGTNAYQFTAIGGSSFTTPRKLFSSYIFSSAFYLDCFSYKLTPSNNNTDCVSAVDDMQFYATTTKANSLFQGSGPMTELRIDFGHLIGGGVMSASVFQNHFFDAIFYFGPGPGAAGPYTGGSLLPIGCSVTVKYSYNLYSSLSLPMSRTSFVPYWKNMTPHVLISGNDLKFELTRAQVPLPTNGDLDTFAIVPQSVHWCDAVTSANINRTAYKVTYSDYSTAKNGLWDFQMDIKDGLDPGYYWLCVRPAGWSQWFDVGYLDVHGNNPAYFLLPTSTVTGGNNVVSGTVHIFDFYGIGLNLTPNGDQAMLIDATRYSCSEGVPYITKGTDLGPHDLFGKDIKVARWEATIPNGDHYILVCYKRLGFHWTSVHFLDQVPPNTAAHIKDLNHLMSEGLTNESMRNGISSGEQLDLDSTRISTRSTLSVGESQLADIDPTILPSSSAAASSSSSSGTKHSQLKTSASSSSSSSFHATAAPSSSPAPPASSSSSASSMLSGAVPPTPVPHEASSSWAHSSSAAATASPASSSSSSTGGSGGGAVPVVTPAPTATTTAAPVTTAEPVTTPVPTTTTTAAPPTTVAPTTVAPTTTAGPTTTAVPITAEPTTAEPTTTQAPETTTSVPLTPAPTTTATPAPTATTTAVPPTTTVAPSTPEPSTVPPLTPTPTTTTTPAPTTTTTTAPTTTTPAPTAEPTPTTTGMTPAPTTTTTANPTTVGPSTTVAPTCTSGSAPKGFSDPTVEAMNYASLVMDSANVPDTFKPDIAGLLCVAEISVVIVTPGSSSIAARQRRRPDTMTETERAAHRHQDLMSTVERATLVNGSYILNVRIQCLPGSSCAGQSKERMTYLAYVMGNPTVAKSAGIDLLALGVQGTTSSSAYDIIHAGSSSTEDTAKHTAIIAGIIVGAILIIIIAVVVAVLVLRRKKGRRTQSFPGDVRGFDDEHAARRAGHDDLEEFDDIRQPGGPGGVGRGFTGSTFEISPPGKRAAGEELDDDDDAASPDHMIPKPGRMNQGDDRNEYLRSGRGDANIGPGTVLQLDEVEIVDEATGAVVGGSAKQQPEPVYGGPRFPAPTFPTGAVVYGTPVKPSPSSSSATSKNGGGRPKGGWTPDENDC